MADNTSLLQLSVKDLIQKLKELYKKKNLNTELAEILEEVAEMENVGDKKAFLAKKILMQSEEDTKEEEEQDSQEPEKEEEEEEEEQEVVPYTNFNDPLEKMSATSKKSDVITLSKIATILDIPGRTKLKVKDGTYFSAIKKREKELGLSWKTLVKNNQVMIKDKIVSATDKSKSSKSSVSESKKSIKSKAKKAEPKQVIVKKPEPEPDSEDDLDNAFADEQPEEVPVQEPEQDSEEDIHNMSEHINDDADLSDKAKPILLKQLKEHNKLCDLSKNKMCPDDLDCLVVDKTKGLCVDKKIGNVNPVWFNYNGKRIVGSKKAINILKQELNKQGKTLRLYDDSNEKRAKLLKNILDKHNKSKLVSGDFDITSTEMLQEYLDVKELPKVDKRKVIELERQKQEEKEKERIRTLKLKKLTNITGEDADSYANYDIAGLDMLIKQATNEKLELEGELEALNIEIETDDNLKTLRTKKQIATEEKGKKKKVVIAEEDETIEEPEETQEELPEEDTDGKGQEVVTVVSPGPEEDTTTIPESEQDQKQEPTDGESDRVQRQLQDVLQEQEPTGYNYDQIQKRVLKCLGLVSA